MNVVNAIEEYKRKLPKWTKEETDRVVAVFELLISMDKKQNPENYQITIRKLRFSIATQPNLSQAIKGGVSA